MGPGQNGASSPVEGVSALRCSTAVRRRHHLVLLTLALSLLASSCWLGYAIHRLRSSTTAILGALTPDDIEARSQKDPLVGRQVSLQGLLDSAGRPLSVDTKSKVLLFVAGPKLSECSSCGTEEFIVESDAFARTRQGVLTYVVWVGQADLKGLGKPSAMYEALRFALDPDLSVSRRLNCFFFPRVYVVSGSGTLRYVSAYGWQAHEVMQEVRRATAVKEGGQ
jgi:hypothetical protein